MATARDAVHLSPEVVEAVDAGHPVVALESTIISHGMPYPQNVEMAARVEQTVRDHGAVPATIAVLDGACTVGLTPAQIEHLGSAPDVLKATTRDLPYLVATRRTGATTVASTMFLAAAAGIRVFATGGVGGVHRGAQATFDVSADLTEMATTPVAVVSAGVKSILDIGLTLERLETLGVPVVVLGSDEFPSFYSRRSDYPAPRRADSPGEVAELLHATWDLLGLRCGVSVANPIPVEAEIPADEITSVIERALAKATDHGVTGQAVTPFLLAEVVAATGGKSLEANIALVLHNAAVASQIAVADAALRARLGR